MKRLSLAVLLLICFSSRSFAQEGFEHLSPFAHGTGRSYVTMSRGLEASGINPALLAIGIPNNSKFEFNLPFVIGLDAGASFNQDTLEQTFKADKDSTGTGFDNKTRRSLTNLMKDDRISGRLDYSLLGLAYYREGFGGLSFNWTHHAATKTSISSAFLSKLVAAEANLVSGPMSVENADAQALWYTEYNLSYGREFIKRDPTPDVFIHDLAFGVGIKLVQGIAYARLEPDNYFRSIPDQDSKGNGFVSIQSKYKIRYSYVNTFAPHDSATKGFSFSDLLTGSAGSGFGFDLGASAGLLNNHSGRNILRVGTSVTDIGSITWTENTMERTHGSDTVLINYGSAQQIADVNDSLQELQGTLNKKLGDFSSSLPTTFRFGVAYDLTASGLVDLGSSDLIATVETAVGLNDVVGSTSRFGVGLGWMTHSEKFSPRLGIGLGFEDGNTDLTLGVGFTLLNTISLDFASSRLNQLFSSGSRTDMAFAFRVLI